MKPVISNFCDQYLYLFIYFFKDEESQRIVLRKSHMRYLALRAPSVVLDQLSQREA